MILPAHSGTGRAQWALFATLMPVWAFAADPSTALPLPYSTRTLPYSAYSGTTRGDIRTVGMAGATLGLADTFAAAGDNPAGLAMTIHVGDTHASANQIQDGRLQSMDAPIHATSAGAALSLSNFGISLGAINTWGEGQFYRIPLSGGDFSEPTYADLSVREYRAGGAWRFSSLPLAVGAQLRLGVLRQSLGTQPNALSNPAVSDSTLGITLGALYRLPRRLILGASWSSPMTYDPSLPSGSAATQFSTFSGLIQPASSPAIGGVGLGFIPNRLFRADFTLKFAGSTPGAALLSDQSLLAGEGTTWEPRFGAAYVFGDFSSIRATAFAGTYLEPSRLKDRSSRVHATGGVELKWAFVNFGLGFDVASSYQNFLGSIGIDPFAVMERLDLIPRPATQSPRGFLPGPLHVSDDGLSSALRDQPRIQPERSGLDPIQIGIDIPKKIEEKVRNFSPGGLINSLKEMPSDVMQDITQDIDEVSTAINKKLGSKSKPSKTSKPKPSKKSQ
jgi:hypothetical protein